MHTRFSESPQLKFLKDTKATLQRSLFESHQETSRRYFRAPCPKSPVNDSQERGFGRESNFESSSFADRALNRAAREFSHLRDVFHYAAASSNSEAFALKSRWTKVVCCRGRVQTSSSADVPRPFYNKNVHSGTRYANFFQLCSIFCDPKGSDLRSALLSAQGAIIVGVNATGEASFVVSEVTICACIADGQSCKVAELLSWKIERLQGCKAARLESLTLT